jgi:hypothetical protein
MQKKFNIKKALKGKSLTRGLLEIFTLIITYTYLLIAISLIIFSLPLALPELLDYFFNNKQIDPSIVCGYMIFVFTTILLALIMIKKYGAETFWKTMIRSNVFYKGKSGKYYKWFVYFIIFFIVMANIVAFLRYLFEK